MVDKALQAHGAMESEVAVFIIDKWWVNTTSEVGLEYGKKDSFS
jgi:hypothetical protein